MHITASDEIIQVNREAIKWELSELMRQIAGDVIQRKNGSVK